MVDLVDEARLAAPPTQLPAGVYWFSGLSDPPCCWYSRGRLRRSVPMPIGSVPDGSALDNALGWVESAWEDASTIPSPRFKLSEQVIVSSTGIDGLVLAPRRFVVNR